MNQTKLNALISLLDDRDSIVYDLVENELLSHSENIIPHLENKWEDSDDELFQNRIENLIHTIQNRENKKLIEQWLHSKKKDLLEGYLLFDKFFYPELPTLSIIDTLETLRKDVWIELSETLTYMEKATVLNHYLFNVKSYQINKENYFSPNNHFLNQLLSTKRGNVYSIALFYTILARQLELPVHLVDYPNNPLVAITDKKFSKIVHGEDAQTDVLFYINPARKGAFAGRKELEYHLKKNSFYPMQKYMEPKEDRLFLQRLVESAKISYQQASLEDKMNQTQEILNLFD